MSYETGAIKYFIGVLTTVTGFVSMYIFGGGFMSVLEALKTLLQGGNFIEAGVVYLLTKALPPTSIESIITQAVVGGFIAAGLWYLKTPRQ